MSVCPCCGNAQAEAFAHPQPHHACSCCGHRWRVRDGGEQVRYAEMRGRNEKVPEGWLQRKYTDRLADITPLLRSGLRILEVGCAEGELGARVKRLAEVEYAGIEISRDAIEAAKHLDRVSSAAAAEWAEQRFDLLLSFHVLEHIPDIAAECGNWGRLLASSGALLVEVPNGSGHPLRSWDTHPEHLHFFTSASLAALLQRAGLAVVSLTSGHYESPIYADSLRVTARHAPDDGEKMERLFDQFRQRIPGPFAVFGIGGDFRNVVLPLLDRLPVVALFDSDASRIGERVTEAHSIRSFDPERFGDLPILVASLRFRREIGEQLQAMASMPLRLIGLDEIYEPE